MSIFIKKIQLLKPNVFAERALSGQLIVFTVFVMLCLLTSSSVYSAVPVVKNLDIQSQFDNIIIRYDLQYADSGTVFIGLECSINSGGTYNVTPLSVTGNLGNVFPGSGKQIIWNSKTDFPSVSHHNIRVRMLADDGTHTIRYITRKGAVMALIPGGNFQMGSNSGDDGMPMYGDEEPKHTVYVDSFYMDTQEVTNAQYSNFLSATGYHQPLYWDDPKFNAPNQPVVGVTWYDATIYCLWAGKRLPTEAEWEKAARGGLVENLFPWGNTLNRNYGNFAGVEGYDTWSDTAPVGSFMPNNYGLFDMIGNAYEWCWDNYDFSYYSVSPDSNPTGPVYENTRVTRGGSCYDGSPDYLQSATRYSYASSTANGFTGFRCVMDVE